MKFFREVGGFGLPICSSSCWCWSSWCTWSSWILIFITCFNNLYGFPHDITVDQLLCTSVFPHCILLGWNSDYRCINYGSACLDCLGCVVHHEVLQGGLSCRWGTQYQHWIIEFNLANHLSVIDTGIRLQGHSVSLPSLPKHFSCFCCLFMRSRCVVMHNVWTVFGVSIPQNVSIVWGMYKYEAGDSLVKLENIAGCPWNLCGVSVECSIKSFSQKKFIGEWLWASHLRVAVTNDHCKSSNHRKACWTNEIAESLQTICEFVQNMFQ